MSTDTDWHTGPLLGFDTETTGTDVTDDRIVTVALVHSVGPGPQNETVATWLIDPGREIPDGARQVHGISTEHARAHGMAPAEALEEVASLLKDALDRGIPIVAYNAGFDLQILENELRRHGLPTLTERIGHEIAPVLDPLVIDRGVDRYRKGKRKLGDLLALYGIEQDGRLHTADVDVSGTLAVLRALVERHERLARSSLEDLFRQQVEWHREWAENFLEYMRKQGRSTDVSTVWPL